MSLPDHTGALTAGAHARQAFANDKGWKALAVELRVRILQELHATDLSSCAKVDRALKKLVDGTSSLRYKLTLYAAGMRDGPPGGSHIPKRLAQLEEYEHTWHSKDARIQQLGRGTPRGGVFVVFDDQRSQLEVLRPASLFSGVPEKMWTVDLSNLADQEGPEFEAISSCVVDAAQDLLVLTVLPPPEEEDFPDLYVASLSTNGATHPLAARRRLDAGSCIGMCEPSDNVEIVGDLIGWTVHGMDICMSVFNWKTGGVVWFDSVLDEEDFCWGNQIEYHTRCHILDSEHVLKISRYSLTVYQIVDTREATGELVCKLELPPLAQGFEATYEESHIQRPPQTPDCSPHFEGDPNVSVLVAHYDVHPVQWRAGYHAKLFVIIPISTILAKAFAGSSHKPVSATVPWGDWGASGARLVLLPYKTSSCYDWGHIEAFGSRVAITVSPSFSEGGNTVPPELAEVTVLDVRQGVKPAASSGANGGVSPAPGLLILDRYTKEDTPIFKDTVEAKMPYRMMQTRIDTQKNSVALVGTLTQWGAAETIY